MQLHQRGVDLLVNLMDAADHVEKLSHAEIRTLLTETVQILGDLLKRDIPQIDRNNVSS